jgi:carbamoyltransferase
MKYLGVVSLGHDASVALVEDGNILFAGHSERYSKKKNDGNINEELLNDAFCFGKPDAVVWYEKPWLKKTRMVMAGQESLFAPVKVKQHLIDFKLDHLPFHKVGHHESHAAAGYYTSKFDDASILVCDAIGEWTTISIWKAKFGKMEMVWHQNYPDSLGLLYSAMTQRVGLKPNEEEYIMMGMAALGDDHRLYDEICFELLEPGTFPEFKLKHNVHRGIKWWRPELKSKQDMYDIAASMQRITEIYLRGTCRWIAENLPSENLILMGGVALNCKANTEIASLGMFENIWIMPNPGDAGSAIGAVAAHTKQRLDWQGPYLGFNIDREFDTEGALKALLGGEIIGIANGRAEFGPRALGNRSLIADPRGADIKDKVNMIKKREMFRPFAPVILEHLADKYFEMPRRVGITPYMQFTAKCKYPEQFPAICHFDNTSRVQTVNGEQNPQFYNLIERFYKETGCPMVLNTSLNIKGQPLVNDWQDAIDFQNQYGVKVF